MNKNTSSAGLILTRKTYELIYIGKDLAEAIDIKIEVLGISDNQVRLRIEAPPDYEIHREEVYYRIKNQSCTEQITVNDNA